tara:strand:- start:34 stop:366 length:333 start_codon:yes stop_codon:yes gene_type:complete
MNFNNWTKEEFKAYILIYASQSNFTETDEELKFIESRFDSKLINKINIEMKELSDYKKATIITDYIKLKNFSQKDLDEILLEIQNIYRSDGAFDIIERAAFSVLQKLLKI